MTTIQVTVENTSQAKMLLKWLNEIKFVKKTTMQKENVKKGNIKAISEILSSIEPNQVLSELTDPIDFQNKLRNEW